MKIELNQYRLTVQRTHGEKAVKNESALLYKIKTALNAVGANMIKKHAAKDGHMVSEAVHYLRAKNAASQSAHVSIWDDQYAVRNSAQDYNAYESVSFAIVLNCFMRQSDCKSRLAKLASDLANGRELKRWVFGK